MIQLIIDLMNLGVHVAIVTAAGYPGDTERFEQRVQGLLAAFKHQQLPDHITDRCMEVPLCIWRFLKANGGVPQIEGLGICRASWPPSNTAARPHHRQMLGRCQMIWWCSAAAR